MTTANCKLRTATIAAGSQSSSGIFNLIFVALQPAVSDNSDDKLSANINATDYNKCARHIVVIYICPVSQSPAFCMYCLLLPFAQFQLNTTELNADIQAHTPRVIKCCHIYKPLDILHLNWPRYTSDKKVSSDPRPK